MIRAHWSYLKYVLRHKWYVFRAARITRCSYWSAIIHDWSKFLPREWFPYVHSFYNSDGSKRTHGGAGPGETYWGIKARFDYAWLRHQHTNPHHWQFWILCNDVDGTYPLPMPPKYVREMIADWVGAGMAISGRKDPNPWYKKNKDKMLLHKDTRQLVEYELLDIASLLREKGELSW